MTTMTCATPTTLLNQPRSHVRGYSRPGHTPLIEADPLVGAWSRGEAALPGLSYRQPTVRWSDITSGPDAAAHAQHGRAYESRNGWCEHPSCRKVVEAIASSQSGIPRARGSELAPFRTYESKASEPPRETVSARRAGVRALSLDMPSTEGTTMADTIPDGDRVEYTGAMDPETADQIAMEQSMRYSGPVTRIRRKLNSQGDRDIVVVDRWGHRTEPDTARVWYDRLADGTVAMVFEGHRPYDYRKVRDGYIRRIARANGGTYPTWQQQEAMRSEGIEARLDRQQTRVPCPIDAQLDRDPFRFHFRDDEMHEPHEIVDVSDLVTEGMAITAFKRPLADLLPEEVSELEAQIANALREAGRLDEYTVRVMRGHRDWTAASAARRNTNGAEYLAGLDDAIESRAAIDAR